MPRSAEQARRELWRGAGDAWTYVTELLAGIAVWGGIGYGLDRLFGTWPILFVIGAVIGHAAGVYVVIVRSKRATEQAQRRA